MVSNWPKMPLRAAGVSLIDCDHSTPPPSESGYPYIAIPQLKQGRIDISTARRITHNDFVKWTKKANPESYDVVLSRRCNPGETAFVPPGLQCALGQNLVLLRADGQFIFPPYLRWLVRGDDWWQQVGQFINVGAIFDSLKCADIPNFVLPIPSFAEQKAIFHVLSSLDEKIEINRQMNETLEEMARALFRSWFVDYDPVHAKAEGRKPEGMDEETAALFPSEFVESEQGMIPKEWRVATVGDVAAINEWTLAKSDAMERIRYIEISEVQRGNVGIISEYDRGEEPSRARRRLRHGDTVLSTVRPDRGAYFLAHHPENNLIASTGFAVITPRIVPWAYLFLALTQDDVFTFLGHIADGGAYPAINPGVIGELKIAIPEEAVLRAFSEYVAPLIEQMEIARKENQRLAALRDELLPKLISGEVRLPEDMIAEFEVSA